jgi:class 3 adenylate cyclase
MSSHKRDSAVSGDIADSTTPKYRSGRPVFVRYAAQHLGLLAALSITGFIVGIAYRSLIDDPSERDLANYVRSGMHGVGIALAGWTVQAGFASTARSPFGLALRRLPVAGEVVVRSLVMTAALTIAGVSLQLVLYAEPLQLRWINVSWFTTTLPRIIAIGFAISLVAGVITETGRLIGGPMLISVVLGTYHRPAREQRIVMFLDLANSTRLAEDMGELRVHDLITRFFFDIDEPICEHGGAVHAYVGDEVIVTWPVTGDAACDARCVACFFAIERKMARLAVDYDREFKVVPRFRAGLHVGTVIVSECGDAKRQLAYFGDTMNVAARLCEYCKVVDQRLVISGDLLHQMTIPGDLRVGGGESIALRGRQERIEAHAIELPAVITGLEERLPRGGPYLSPST